MKPALSFRARVPYDDKERLFHLRIAKRHWRCLACGSLIKPLQPYYADEPSSLSKVQVCRACAEKFSRERIAEKARP